MAEREDIEVVEGDVTPVMPEETAVVPGTDFIPVDPDKYLERIQQGLDFLLRLHKIMYSYLNPLTDLTAIGSGDRKQIRLTKHGVYKLVQLVGGQIKFLRGSDGFPMVKKHTGEDENGKWYGFEAFAQFIRSDGRVFEGSSLITSRHKFLGKESIWETKVIKGKERNIRTGSKLKDLKDIEETDVRKSAITFAEKAAVTKGLGLSVFTTEQLREEGLEVDKIPGWTFEEKRKLAYESGSSKGSSGTKSSSQKKEPAPSTKKKKPETEPEQKDEPEGKLDSEKPISAERKTAIMEQQQKHSITDKEMKAILGTLGYEKLSEIRNKDCEALRLAMKEAALAKL